MDTIINEEKSENVNVNEKPQRKKRFGDRRDGYKMRTLPAMQYITPYIMAQRNDATNLFKSRIELTQINKYIRHKTKDEGLVNFGFMHVLVAAYVRTLCSHPGLNRFIAGQKIFHRNEISLSMMVKTDLSLNSEEASIKPTFCESDTIYDVYNKINAEIEKARTTNDTTGMNNVARKLNACPSFIINWFVGILKFIDYIYGLPKSLDKASPFHCSLFISNLGSLGIPPVYHHLYNFGNCPIFSTFGKIYRENEIDDDGKPAVRKYVDYTIVADERIADGHYYGEAFKTLHRLMCHPWELDVPPEKIVYDID